MTLVMSKQVDRGRLYSRGITGSKSDAWLSQRQESQVKHNLLNEADFKQPWHGERTSPGQPGFTSRDIQSPMGLLTAMASL